MRLLLPHCVSRRVPHQLSGWLAWLGGEGLTTFTHSQEGPKALLIGSPVTCGGNCISENYQRANYSLMEAGQKKCFYAKEKKVCVKVLSRKEGLPADPRNDMSAALTCYFLHSF